MTSTPAINLPLGTITRTPWGWGTAKDRRKLKGTNRRYLQPSKSDTASNGVIGTAMRSCIHRDPTHPDQRPLRPPNKILSFWFELNGTLRALDKSLSTYGGVLILATRFANLQKKRPLCQYSLLLKKKLSAVVLTLAKNLSPVLLIPFRNNQKAQNCPPVSTTLPINF